jgi:hypothetical protein
LLLLKGGTTRERSIFLEALQEILGPLENSGYVLVRKSLLGWLVRKDYHTIPTVLGKNKDLAEYVRKMWARHVEPSDSNPGNSRWGSCRQAPLCGPAHANNWWPSPDDAPARRSLFARPHNER